jgi:hypothetical protein
VSVVNLDHRVYKNLMHIFGKSGKTLILSAVMFVAGASTATIGLSYLPGVIAAPKIVAQGLKQDAKTVVNDEERQLKFELQGCSRVSQKVSCDILMTNLASESRVIDFRASYASPNSRLIDDSGNEYIAQKVKIGSQESDSLRTELIAGIPTKAILTFEIPPQVNKFAVIEAAITAYGYSDGGAEIRPKFRNISLSGSQATNPGSESNCPPTRTKK